MDIVLKNVHFTKWDAAGNEHPLRALTQKEAEEFWDMIERDGREGDSAADAQIEFCERTIATEEPHGEEDGFSVSYDTEIKEVSNG